MTEKDLKIYDVWESPNGNLFLKVHDRWSLALGDKGNHNPNDWDLKMSQFVKQSDLVPVKKVGRLKFKKKKSVKKTK
jgi:hypothetical protein